MNRLLLSAFIVLLQIVNATAQLDTVKALSFNAVVSPFTLATTSFINNGNKPCNFFPLCNVAGMEYAFRNDSTFGAWLQSKTTAVDPDQRRMEMMRAEGTLLQKTLLFLNNYIIFDEFNSDDRDRVLAKKYSTIGGKLSEAHKQCGNFVTDAMHDIVTTGDDPANFATVSFDAHTVGQFHYRGGWVKVDLDPQEPGFMELNPASINGYASVQDIVADTTLFQNRYKISLNGVDSIDLSPVSNSDYRKLYTNPHEYSYYMCNQTRKVTGDWTLCAGCKVERSANMNDDWFYVDTTDAGVARWYGDIYKWLKLYTTSNDQAYLDSSADLLSTKLNITSANAQTRIQHGSIVFGAKYSELFSRLYTNDVMPTLTLTIPAHRDTIVIGRDLKLPFLVNSVNCTTCQIGDSLVTGSAQWDLWTPSSSNVEYVKASSINYLDSGFLAPQYTASVMKLYYNPGLYDFSNGLVIDGLTSTDTLVNNNNIHQVSTGLATVDADTRPMVSVYPNPMQMGSKAVITCGNSFRVFDTEGREHFYETVKIGDGKFSVTFPDAGTYLIYSPGLKTSSVMVF